MTRRGRWAAWSTIRVGPLRIVPEDPPIILPFFAYPRGGAITHVGERLAGDWSAVAELEHTNLRAEGLSLPELLRAAVCPPISAVWATPRNGKDPGFFVEEIDKGWLPGFAPQLAVRGPIEAPELVVLRSVTRFLSVRCVIEAIYEKAV